MTDRLLCGNRHDDPCCAVEIRTSALDEALRLLDDHDRGLLTIAEVRLALANARTMAERGRWSVAA